MTFEATVRDARGLRQRVRREAAGEAALLASLRAEGFLVLDVTEETVTDALPSAWHPAWLRPMTSFDVEMGLRQLAALLRSGVTLLAALSTVEEQARSPRACRAWKRVRERVFTGSSFAAALAEQRTRFGEILVRLAEVGERTGELEHALTRAAEHLESRRSLRSTVVNALSYPLFAILAAVGVSAYLVTAVIPKVAEFLQAGGAELPALTQALVDCSFWITQHALAILAGLGGAVAAWLVVRLAETGHELEDALLLRLPVSGGILRLAGTALFARAMQIMCESGVTLIDALDTAGALMDNRRFRRRVGNARAAVLRGDTLATGLAPAREFSPMLRRMAAVGEASGAFPEAFGEAARFHEHALALAVKRLGMLIEPVMIVITAGIVGFVYIAFFMAIFAIAGTK